MGADSTPTLVSTGDVQAYLARLDPAIQGLQSDVTSQFVTQDPAVLDAQAATYRSQASQVPGLLGGGVSAGVNGLADDTQAQADTNRQRASLLTPDQAAAQIAFSQSWFSFYHDYVQHAQQIQSGVSVPLGAGSDYNWLQGIETSYRQYLAQFQALGGVSSSPVVPTAAQIAQTTNVPTAFPWTTALIVAGLGIVAYLVWETKHPRKTPSSNPPANVTNPATP